MFVHNLDPIVFTIPLGPLGELPIRWYGLAYLAAFFIVVYWLQWYSKKGFVKLSKDQCWDFGYDALVGTIIGARLYEVLVWNPMYYLENPLKIIAVWEGGMAFHGGLIGFALGGLYFCRKNKVSFLKIADFVVVPIAIGLSLGRIANFINGELWGPVTNVSWCVQYNGICRHPYQLYSVVKHWLLAGILFWLQGKKLKEGSVFLHFVWLYGAFRFFLDYYRDDTIYWVLLGLSPGQISSLAMVVVGLAGLYWLKE